MTVVLYPAIDANGAFHRNAGLQAMVASSDILSIVIEGYATVGDYPVQLAPVAARYGIDGRIEQAMIGGHGNATDLVMRQVADLLALPPASAQHAPLPSPPPAPLPAYVSHLRALLGAGPNFPPAAGIAAALGPFASEEEILTAIGRPLAGAPAGGASPPNANIKLGRSDVPDLNDFAVTPLRRNGVVTTVGADLRVHSRPTTATAANVFAYLPPATPV